jgi:hypothetical protein
MERKCVLESIAMNDRPTPETDAEAFVATYDYFEKVDVVLVSFAERLERQRDEAREQLTQAIGSRSQYQVKMIRAEEALKESRAHAERLADALEYCADIIGSPDKEPDWWSDNDCDKAWDDSQAALAAYRVSLPRTV